jgi:hypothetical protein
MDLSRVKFVTRLFFLRQGSVTIRYRMISLVVRPANLKLTTGLYTGKHKYCRLLA